MLKIDYFHFSKQKKIHIFWRLQNMSSTVLYQVSKFHGLHLVTIKSMACSSLLKLKRKKNALTTCSSIEMVSDKAHIEPRILVFFFLSDNWGLFRAGYKFSAIRVLIASKQFTVKDWYIWIWMVGLNFKYKF